MNLRKQNYKDLKAIAFGIACLCLVPSLSLATHEAKEQGQSTAEQADTDAVPVPDVAKTAQVSERPEPVPPAMAREDVPLLQNEDFRKWLTKQGVELPPKDRPLDDLTAKKIQQLINRWIPIGMARRQPKGERGLISNWLTSLDKDGNIDEPPLDPYRLSDPNRPRIQLDGAFWIAPMTAESLYIEVIDDVEMAKRMDRIDKTLTGLGFTPKPGKAPQAGATLDFRHLLKTPEGQADLKLAKLDHFAGATSPQALSEDQYLLPIEPGYFRVVTPTELHEIRKNVLGSAATDSEPAVVGILQKHGISQSPSGDIQVEDAKRALTIEALLDPKSELNEALKLLDLGTSKELLASLLSEDAKKVFFASAKDEKTAPAPFLLSSVTTDKPAEAAALITMTEKARDAWHAASNRANDFRKLSGRRYFNYESLKKMDLETRRAAEAYLLNLTDLARMGTLPDSALSSSVPAAFVQDLKQIATIARAKKQIPKESTLAHTAITEAEALVLDKARHRYRFNERGWIYVSEFHEFDAPLPTSQNQESATLRLKKPEGPRYSPSHALARVAGEARNEADELAYQLDPSGRTILGQQRLIELLKESFESSIAKFVDACNERYTSGGFLGAGNYVANEFWNNDTFKAIDKRYKASIAEMEFAVKMIKEAAADQPALHDMFIRATNHASALQTDCYKGATAVTEGLRNDVWTRGIGGIALVLTMGASSAAEAAAARAAAAAGVTGQAATVVSTVGSTALRLGGRFIVGSGVGAAGYTVQNKLNNDPAQPFSLREMGKVAFISGGANTVLPFLPKPAQRFAANVLSYGSGQMTGQAIADGRDGKGWRWGDITVGAGGTLVGTVVATKSWKKPTTPTSYPPPTPNQALPSPAASSQAPYQATPSLAGPLAGKGTPPTTYPTLYKYSPNFVKNMLDQKLLPKLKAFNPEISDPAAYRQKVALFQKELNASRHLPATGNADPRSVVAARANVGLTPIQSKTDALAFLKAALTAEGSKGYLHSKMQDKWPNLYRVIAAPFRFVKGRENGRKLSQKELDDLGKELWGFVERDDMPGAWAKINATFGESLSYRQFSARWTKIKIGTGLSLFTAGTGGALRVKFAANDETDESKQGTTTIGKDLHLELDTDPTTKKAWDEWEEGMSTEASLDYEPVELDPTEAAAS